MKENFILSFTDARYEFDELKKFLKIPVLKLGEFNHSYFGEISLTQEKFDKMVENYKENVVGTELMLDEDHTRGKSLGWFREIYQLDDILYADIIPTKIGYEYLRDKIYKYSSAEFTDSYKNESGEDFGPTLLGVALTNRPFLKMGSITFNSKDLFSYNFNKQEELEDDEMNIKELSERLDSLERDQSKLKEANENLVTELNDTKQKLEVKEKVLSDVTEKLKKSEQELKDKENEAEFNKLLNDGKAVEAQREAFYKGDFRDFISKQPKAMNFSGVGSDHQKEEDKRSAEDIVLEKAKAIQEKDKVSFSDALDAVFASDKDLKEKYIKEVGA